MIQKKIVNSTICSTESTKLKREFQCPYYKGMFKKCDKGILVLSVGGSYSCIYVEENQLNRIQQNG
ncbi:hypothetical protein ACFL23_03075 [Patescibacteria group bacterium]